MFQHNTVSNNHIKRTYMNTITNVNEITVWQNLSIKNLPNEIWKPINGFSYYSVSNLGRIKAIERYLPSRWKGSNIKHKEKILKQTLNKDGYFVRVNESFSKVLGYSTEYLLAHPIVNFLHPSDVSTTLEKIEDGKKGRNVSNFINVLS